MNQSKEQDSMITEPAHLNKIVYPDPIESLMSFRTMSRTSSRPKTSAEIRNISRTAKQYKRDLEYNDANYELKEFENRNGIHKNFLQKNNIPLPEGVDLDMISDLDSQFVPKQQIQTDERQPHSVMRSPVKRYSASSRNFSAHRSAPISRTGHDLRIPFMNKTGHPGMCYRCPACNPDTEEQHSEKKTAIHIPKGGCHWQLLDAPEQPKTSFVPKKQPSNTRPFLLPARHIGPPGIQLLVDDLVEIREHDQELYEKRVAKLKLKDKNMYDAIIRNRVMSSAEQVHKFHLKTQDLERRSGQLKVAAKLSWKPPPPKKVVPTDPDDLDALASLKKYDDALWSDYQYRKKNDAVSQLMVQENAQQLRSATKPVNETDEF